MVDESAELRTKARSCVRYYLEQTNPDRHASASLPDGLELAAMLDRFPSAAIHDALVEELGAQFPYERLSAARLLLEQYPLSNHREQATALFRDALRSVDEAYVILALNVGSCWAAVPVELKSEIGRLLNHSNREVRLNAAFSAVSIERLRGQCTEVIGVAMTTGSVDQALVLAALCIREGIIVSRAWKCLKEKIKGPHKTKLLERFLMSVPTVAPLPRTAGNLVRLATERRLSVGARAAAIRLLGAFPPGNVAIQQLLMDAVTSVKPQLVYAACHAYYEQKCFPEEAIDLLISNLSSPSVEMRETAALCLFRCCPLLTDESRIEAVIDRLVVERDLEVFWKLLQICVAAGDAAMPHVITLLGEISPLRRLIMVAALTHMGPESCNELLRQFAQSTSPEAKRIFAEMLATSKLENSHLLAHIRQMIVGDDPEDVRLALLAISNAGEAAAFMTPDLLQIMSGGNAELARMATNVIEGIGPAALPYLHSYSGARDERHHLLIAKLESQGKDAAEHELSWYDNIAELELFAIIAEEMQKQDGVSLTQLSLQIEEEGREYPDHIKTSPSSLQRNIREVQEKISARKGRRVVLTEKRKKKTVLTKEGLALYKSILSYLERLA